MKRLWLILCAVTLMLSSCVVGLDSSIPNPTPISDPSLYADVIMEYASNRRRQELFEYPGGRIVTVISMAELAMDSRLLGWAMEAASKCLLGSVDILGRPPIRFDAKYMEEYGVIPDDPGRFPQPELRLGEADRGSDCDG